MGLHVSTSCLAHSIIKQPIKKALVIPISKNSALPWQFVLDCPMRGWFAVPAEGSFLNPGRKEPVDVGRLSCRYDTVGRDFFRRASCSCKPILPQLIPSLRFPSRTVTNVENAPRVVRWRLAWT